MSKPHSLTPGDHLYLIDGSGYIFRASHALPPLTRNTSLRFLFRRPRWARLADSPKLETAGKVWHSAGHEQHVKHTGAGP